MKIPTMVLCCSLLLAPPLYAGDKNDILVMKNGDRLHCEIKGLDSGTLYISLDYVSGTIAVEWSKVARLESKRLFIIYMQDGLIYTGTLSAVAGGAEGGPVKLEVGVSPEEKVVVERRKVVQLGGTSDKFWARFNGNLSSGISYTKANEQTQYNFSAVIEYPRARWGAQLSLNSTLAANSGVSTSTRNQVGAYVTKRLRWTNYFYAGFANGLQSTEQGIQFQGSVGMGFGRYLFNTNRVSWTVLAGVLGQSANYDESTVAVPAQELLAATFQTQLKVFVFSKTNLTLSASATPALTEAGRTFYYTNASYYVKLFGAVNWNLSLYGNWDTKPPAGFQDSDYGLSSGLGWSFGSRH